MRPTQNGPHRQRIRPALPPSLRPVGVLGFFFELFLDHWVGLGRDHTDPATTHADPMQKLAHLFAATFNPGQFRNCVRRLAQTFRGMLPKMSLDLDLMLGEFALRLIEVQPLEALNPILSVIAQIADQPASVRSPGESRQSRDAAAILDFSGTTLPFCVGPEDAGDDTVRNEARQSLPR
jgi:hypothetical protein